ncbi:MAG TPA: heparinase II/III family protein [Candidatus Hydrogenedentes bacterium]|nr:heparinase II/III family protein [Candidatus Hydrogenedentota bacterium]HPC15412.1 heparinase II/III family protein [Candidatus Hydrogenedentota bacterium]HRT21149.1 heparinase II/III family protein [Candidatus Hydrogenedentota bacterium]HRT64374.1 heparinase II/III family protein [Candidatus Hydrogenedentota bacterium]
MQPTAMGLVMIALIACPAVFAVEIEPWRVQLEKTMQEESLAPARAKLVKSAREMAALPIVRRAKTLAEVGKNRTWLDGRANALEDEIKQDFALAMSDFAACSLAAKELPVLAAAYLITGEMAFRDRVLAQLEEMAGWSPLQRPGWTLYHPGARLPAGGKDGNWLATGMGVRALCDALDILSSDSVPADLLERLRALLEGEIAGVVDDWQTKRPWFVRSDDPITNQWMLPTEGLVRACLLLGTDSHHDAYELGVGNFMKALDAHGPAGEFEEGMGYASFTVSSMLHTARAMAVQGDRRAVDHRFLKNFPTWLVEHFQPGGMVVNCFDAGAARSATEGQRPLLSMLAVCTGSPVARWALARQTSGPSNDLAGLAVYAMPPVGDEAAPPLFAAYERATRVNWRGSWSDDASGAWVRGGHPADQHDHYDRGHVNFIYRGKCILIEAGTPYYSHPLMGSHFASGAGHNVLQLGTEEPKPRDAGDTYAPSGWQERGVVVPLDVRRLDKQGGEVALEVKSGYAGLRSWRRSVAWDADRMEVEDKVELGAGQANIVMFRWHLGTNEKVSIEEKDGAFRVVWPDAAGTINASVPIVVTQMKMPDNTINTVSEGKPDTLHTCLIVQTNRAVDKATIAAVFTGTHCSPK